MATEVEPALEREFYACADPVSSCSGLLIAAGMSLHPGMQMGVRRKETSSYSPYNHIHGTVEPVRRGMRRMRRLGTQHACTRRRLQTGAAYPDR